jgi:hypothetical protein
MKNKRLKTKGRLKHMFQTAFLPFSNQGLKKNTKILSSAARLFI